jgi:2,3-bisphosphoglycerate-independent phosphoglycerate mutase
MAESQQPRPVMLTILDGWGWREDPADNAILQADTPNFDRLWASCPHAFLRTSGQDVGLPDGQMGNSEVGHLNIGAGRVVMQDLPRIGNAIADGSIAQAPALQYLIDALHKSGGACHLVGLVSPGGVHSHQNHAVALARILAAADTRVLVHAFTDGRDTPPQSGGDDLARLRRALPDAVRLVSVSGRYYAMDRDKRWDRVAKAYNAIVEAQAPHYADAASVVDDAYSNGVTDEFVVPSCVNGYRGMQDGDALLCFNFRADRVREILGALLDPDFDGFARKHPPHFVAAVGMTQYSTHLDRFMQTIFPPQAMTNKLGEVVAAAGRAQLRMAETEKYPHVTYFLNGGEETPVAHEDRTMVPSPKVATYDLQPEMSAQELADKAVAAIGSGQYDMIVLNFANPDMVGHTGSLPAAIRAVETVDACLGRIADAIGAAGGALLVTADHGNAEMMRDPVTGAPHTAHTTNKVPVLLVGGPDAGLADGRLADIAPTLLALMQIAQPAEMTGQSLLRGSPGHTGHDAPRAAE